MATTTPGRHAAGEPQMQAAGPEALAFLAERALRYVRPGQVLGLGTGRAAAAFIRALGASRLKVKGIPTSEATAELARSVGIELGELDGTHAIDIDFDGADEVDPDLNLLKGRGGALVREKVIAAAARRRVILVGAEKLVGRLGERCSLPVEVIPFAAAFVQEELDEHGIRATIRMSENGRRFRSDNGNCILDCEVGPIADAHRLEHEIHTLPGVVGTGLFLGMADLAMVVTPELRVKLLTRKRGNRSAKPRRVLS